jgi:hypothetical protein
VLIGGKGVTSIQQLAGRRIGATGIGSSIHGFARIYNKRYNLNADITVFANAGILAAAVLSGQVAGAVGSYAGFSRQIAAGDFTVLVDTRTAQGRAAAGVKNFPEGAVFGLTDRVVPKRKQLVAFIWAFEQARQWLAKASDTQVASELFKSSIFQTWDRAALAAAVGEAKGYVAPSGGRIPATGWRDALAFYGEWGVPGFDTSDPEFRYNRRVNMGYLNYALKRDATYKLLPLCKKGTKSTPTRPCRRF